MPRLLPTPIADAPALRDRERAHAADRATFLGGSDAASVLGVSPWRTPLELWQEKTLPAAPETFTPDRLRALNRGKRMEPYVLDLLAEETGLVVARRNVRHVDPVHPFLAAEIDAELTNGDAVEIKTVSPFKAKDWGDEQTDEVPVHYVAQVQHGMMITGAPATVFGVLIGGDDFRVYRVERDPMLISLMRTREVDFWLRHVETGEPPPPVNVDDLARLFPRDLGTAVEATQTVLMAYHELRDLRTRAASLEREIEQRVEILKRALGPAARLTWEGRELCSWKTQTTHRFDVTAYRAAHPELAEAFTRASDIRVFRIK